MTNNELEWINNLPTHVKALLEAGYLRESQHPDSPRVEGFLTFDTTQIANGERRADPHARLAAEAYSLLPWVSPESSEIAARSILNSQEREPYHKTAEVLVLWLLNTWNHDRLGEATGWSEYELREHAVDLDVVLGHRRTGSSPFIAHRYFIHLDDSLQWCSRLNEAAGVLWKLDPIPEGSYYRGPMIWADVHDAVMNIYLTPHYLDTSDQMEKCCRCGWDGVTDVCPRSGVPFGGAAGDFSPTGLT